MDKITTIKLMMKDIREHDLVPEESEGVIKEYLSQAWQVGFEFSNKQNGSNVPVRVYQNGVFLYFCLSIRDAIKRTGVPKTTILWALKKKKSLKNGYYFELI